MQNRRIAVRGIVLNGNKVLAVKLKKYEGRLTTGGQDYWCTPGGGVDIGESLIPALEREMIEETGVKPVVGSLLYIQQFKHEEWEHLEFFFLITNAEDYDRINLDTTSHGAIEIAEISFIDLSTNVLLPAFLTKQDLAADAATGTTKVFDNLAE